MGMFSYGILFNRWIPKTSMCERIKTLKTGNQIYEH